ncbi:MAG: alpha/beta fold hydrolase [Nocardioides sp.]
MMLHGGKARSTTPVTGRSLSWRRSWAMQRVIAPDAHQQGVSVWLTKYAVAGWNAGAPDGPAPVPDARWALDRLRAELGQIPVVVLGHSMGARTAVAIADDPLVIGVVALAPWFPPQEPVQSLTGKHLVALHGRRDRITSYAHTRDFVRRTAGVAASSELIDMGDLGHYLIKGREQWNTMAFSQCRNLLSHVAE